MRARHDAPMTASLQPLRIGGVPEHFNLPWRLLLESGALRRAGIDASWEAFFGGTGDMVAALDSDQLDMALRAQRSYARRRVARSALCD